MKETSAKLRISAAMAIFGTIGLFVRDIPLPSCLIALVRGAVGASFLFLVSRLRGKKPDGTAIRQNLVRLCLSGVLMGFNWILLFEAYRYTTVATATLCYYLAPVFVTLASPLVLGEKLTPLRLLCSAAALTGMVLVSGVSGEGFPSGAELTGVLLGLGAAALYAGVVLLNKKLHGLNATDTTVVQLASAAAVMLPYSLLTLWGEKLTCTPMGFVLLTVVAIIHTGVAYLLYFGAIGSLRAQSAALLSYLDPVLAVLLSALVLREPLGVRGIIGAVLILGAAAVGELIHTGKEQKA